MRDSMKMTKRYQLGYMIYRWGISVAVCAFVQFLLFVNSYSNKVFGNVSGILFILVYFIIIFDGAAQLGKRDNKEYTPLAYNVKKALLWGIALTAINIVSIAVFKMNWMLNEPNVFVNFIFYILQSPFAAYVILVPNYFPLWLICLSALIPFIACVLGYVLGKRDFSISDKLYNLMFEKGQKDI